jgi:hypothetical protein
MPRGVPKNGFRKTKNRIAAGLTLPLAVAKTVVPVKVETEAEIAEKLSARFLALDTMTLATVKGNNKSMIVSGPAGVGKSYSIGQILDDNQKQVYSTVIKGYVRPTGLYKTLYEFRHSNCVIVFDDADSIFADDVALNLLKAACDTTRVRTLHWLTETKMEDEEGEKVPRSFKFEGSIIFITNYDFDDMIARGSKMAPHFEALVSRSHYLDLAMKSVDDYCVRIKQVVTEHKMLRHAGFDVFEEMELLDFISTNKNKLRELSLRMVLKLANLMRIDSGNWKTLAKTTCFRNEV